MLDFLPYGILLHRGGSILYSNGTARRLLGAESAEQLLGRNILTLVDPHDRESMEAQLCAARMSPEGSGSDRLAFRRLDGGVSWVEIVSVSTIGTDVVQSIFHEAPHSSEQRVAGQGAAGTAERAADDQASQMAAIGHDLRQPISALELYLAEIESRAATPDLRTLAASAQACIQSLSRLVEVSFDFTGVGGGGPSPAKAPVAVATLFERLRTRFAPIVRAADLDLRIVGTAAVVWTDETLLERILSNLLANAIAYTETGTVLLGLRRRGELARIEVWDTGAGIAPSVRETVFEEFRRIDPRGPTGAGQRVGMGLGLAIVRRLALALGARLDLRSRVGKGSVFAVEVPVVSWRGER